MRSGKALIVGAVWLLAGCGAANDPKPPVDSPITSNTTPGGTVSGKYLLRVQPAAECRSPVSPATFRMDARPDNSGLTSGIQAVLEFNPYLEIELQYATPAVRGNIGTSHDGVSPVELPGTIFFIHGILAGNVSSENGGPGEILQGTMVGDVAFLDPEARCFSVNHTWSLKIR
jgi:hypothetical protein